MDGIHRELEAYSLACCELRRCLIRLARELKKRDPQRTKEIDLLLWSMGVKPDMRGIGFRAWLWWYVMGPPDYDKWIEWLWVPVRSLLIRGGLKYRDIYGDEEQ